MASVEKVSIALSSDLLASVRRAVASGDYASASEVVREALREWKMKRGPSPASRFTLTAAQKRQVVHLCRRFSVRSLSLFGSAVRGDFNPHASDVDVAVVFGSKPDASTATDYFDLKRELERVFGRPVDLVELDAMPDSRLKRHIERTMVALHVDGEAA